MKTTRKVFTLMMVLFWVAGAFAQGPNSSGTYYQGADGKKGEALKTAFYNIIKSLNNVGYDGLIEAYKQTDKRADGYLRDWYSNATSYTWSDRNGNNSEGAGWNREHSIPQSWFSKASPMKSDLVHVLPTDCYVNNRRGSYPFGEVGNVTYSSKNGYSKLGTCKTSGYSGTVFEPNDEIKGDLARIYFYMATCYEDRITNWSGGVITGTKYQPYAQWHFDMLMRWSKNDPVDDREIARNNAVYALQRNRNPFVDYPGLEEYIWGSKKTESFSYDNYSGQTSYGVATPVFSIASGTYYEEQPLTISCSTSGASIRYTTDGSTPTTSSTLYTGALAIRETTTITARAFSGSEMSAVVSVTITIREQGEQPQQGAGIYTLMVANSSLEAGANYLLVGKSGGKYYSYCGMNESGTSGVPKEGTLTGEQIDLSNNTETVVLQLNETTDGWTIYDSLKDQYLALNSDDNRLNVLEVDDTNAARWTISISNTGVATITNKAYSDRQLRFNDSAKMFRCYTSGQQNVYLYKEEVTPTGIVSVENTESEQTHRDNSIYTLDGRKVLSNPASSLSKLPKGIYIKNGKKYIIK